MHGPLHLMLAVIEKQPLVGRTRQRTELACGSIGPFEVMRPVTRTSVNLAMKLSDANFLFGRHLVARHNEKVTIAMDVGVPNGKRPLQVGADEVVAKNGFDSLDEVS